MFAPTTYFKYHFFWAADAKFCKELAERMDKRLGQGAAVAAQAMER